MTGWGTGLRRFTNYVQQLWTDKYCHPVFWRARFLIGWCWEKKDSGPCLRQAPLLLCYDLELSLRKTDRGCCFRQCERMCVWGVEGGVRELSSFLSPSLLSLLPSCSALPLCPPFHLHVRLLTVVSKLCRNLLTCDLLTLSQVTGEGPG